MNLFQKLFTRQYSELSSNSENVKKISEEIDPNYITNIYIGYKLIGIDEDYIKMIFNYETEEIHEFRSKLEEEIQNYILSETLFRSTRIKPKNENLVALDIHNCCLWDSYTVSDTNGLIKLGNKKTERFGFEELQTNPYKIIDFYSELIEVKISKNDFDLNQDIEKIINAVLNFPSLGAYAKCSGYYYIGTSFIKMGVPQKADEWFKKINNNEMNLGISTIADFCKSIAEIYIDKNEIREGIVWFKNGLNWYPKLPVKKKLKELEKLAEE